MDRKIQAAVELRQARRGDLTRPPSNQSEIDNIARTERGEGRFVIHIGGFPTCTHFRAVCRSTLRLKGCRPRVAIFTCGSRSTCCNFLDLLNLLNLLLQEKKSGVSMKLQSSVNEFQVHIRSFYEIAIFSQQVSRSGSMKP